MIRTYEQWQEIFLGMSPKDAADRILKDLVHYQSGCAYEQQDQNQLANALHGYMRMCNSFHRDGI